MKLAIIFLGLASSACTWWWLAYRDRDRRNPGLAGLARRALHSLAAGAAVYFSLLLMGVLYLAISS